MEYMPGGDLAQYIQDHRCPEEDRDGICEDQLCRFTCRD